MATMGINGDDPFMAGSSHAHPPPHRYASFDDNLFTTYSATSPTHARRALEAHLKDTDRRIQDASRLGTALLQQRKDLSARLSEVKQQRQDGEIGPELHKKLVDLEKEYNDIGRESARAFLPRPRVASNDLADPTRSPAAVISADSRASPSKVSAPVRKQRNQPATRIHDIEFATEISTSLLAQVRQLQAAVSERDESLRQTTSEKAQLEADVDAYRQRMRHLDENEQRHRDENWLLETQLQEVTATMKDSTDREQRLNQNLKSTQGEREIMQREFEDLKQAHGKLTEDHTGIRRVHESELGAFRRDLAGQEHERDMLSRRVDELTAQNTELAKAVAYRWNAGGQASDKGLDVDSDDMDAEQDFAEPSPPPSPTKATPRHGMLESETLKSSLNHAHRMIQNLKNNIHREKTEKSELKRMLHDARDELEARRGETGMSAAALALAKKRRSEDPSKLRKPFRPDQLGASRLSREDIIMDDPEWEDHDGLDTPSKRARGFGGEEIDSTDAFETANELEGTATETEAFQTGAENLTGASDGELTETEGALDRRSTMRSIRPSMAFTRDRASFQSTASTDADDYGHVRTPVQAFHPKFKLKAGRTRRSVRDSVRDSEVYDNASNSPAASFVSSNRSTPVAAGQNLGDELDALSDDETIDGTPSRATDSARSSPELVKSRVVSGVPFAGTPVAAKTKPEMVDSSMMTESWEPATDHSRSFLSAAVGAVGGVIAGVAGSALGLHAEHAHNESQPAAVAHAGDDLADDPPVIETPSHTISSIAAQHTEPIMNDYAPPSYSIVPVMSQHTEPVVPTVEDVVAPRHALVSAVSQHTEPLEATRDVVIAPSYGLAQVVSQHIEPLEATTDAVIAPSYGLAQVVSQDIKPLDATRVVVITPSLGLAQVISQHTEPVSPTIENLVAPAHSLIPIVAQDTEPVSPPRLQQPPAGLGVSLQSYAEITPLDSSAFSSPVSMSKGTTQVYDPSEIIDAYRPTPPRRPVRPDGLFGVEDVPIEIGDEGQAPYTLIGTDAARPGAGFFAAQTAGPLISSLTSQAIYIDENQTSSVLLADKSADAEIPFVVELPADEKTRKPFAEISGNGAQAQRNVIVDAKALRIPLKDEGTQTMVSSDEIDSLMRQREKGKAPLFLIPAAAEFATPPSPVKTLANSSSPRRSTDSAAWGDNRVQTPRRAPSGANLRKGGASPPPLPAEAPFKIAAAGGKPPTVGPSTSMGPPLLPASAYKPTHSRMGSFNSQSTRAGTPRVRAPTGRPDGLSRTSSVSSFVTEVDERFRPQGFMYPTDIEPATDPRMIQAITQTMIGEYLWKYTRKAGRTNISNTRHRRFFWVHPYTRTLYWSEQDPSTAGKQQLKAKSVAINAVRVISDDNAYPPGLHRKSLVVITPGREVVFTAPTSQRHETWFNALSYLLLRTTSERGSHIVPNEEVHGMTAADVDEFNPQIGRSASPSKSTRSHPRGLSLSSYTSRTTRQPSPQRQRPHQIEVPSLAKRSMDAMVPTSPVPVPAKTPTRERNQQGSISGRFGSISSMFRAPGSVRGSFSSKRGRAGTVGVQDVDATNVYNAAAASDSAEDLRRVIEAQELEMDRLENVRACCNGKHDVGSLSSRTRSPSPAKSHRHIHTHSHPPVDPASISSRYDNRI